MLYSMFLLEDSIKKIALIKSDYIINLQKMLTLHLINSRKDMSNEKNNRIEEYLDGNMSEKESKEFQNAMQEDSKLANDVSIVKEVNQTISQNRKLKEFQKQLDSLNDTYFPMEEENHQSQGVVRQLPRRNLRRWLVAASILILVVSSIFVWTSLNNGVDSTTLFAAHYEPYGLGQRGNDSNLNELEQKAAFVYNNNNFTEATPLFEEIIQIDTSNEKNILRLGSAYLSTNQSQKAVDTFQKIISNPQSALVQTAQWYQALAYLQLENDSAAKSILNTLANSGNRTYPAKAKALLKSL